MNITEQGDTFNCDCGFSWKRGFSGSHDCGRGLRRQIKDLRQRISELEKQPVLSSVEPIGYLTSRYKDDFEWGPASLWPEIGGGASMPVFLAYAPKLPPLNAELASILGRPNFQCCHLAQALRAGGHDIPRKAEAEQAAVIYFMLGHYLEHGEKWSEKAEEELQRLVATGALK